jgi:hypothetical protein
MEKVVCSKTVTTKKGFKFQQGNSYEFTIHHDGIVIYFSQFDFIKIKSETTFNTYFK